MALDLSRCSAEVDCPNAAPLRWKIAVYPSLTSSLWLLDYGLLECLSKNDIMPHFQSGTSHMSESSTLDAWLLVLVKSASLGKVDLECRGPLWHENAVFFEAFRR